MPLPIPNITSGPTTSGDIQASINNSFAPVTIGGLFGDASSGTNQQTMIIAGVAVAALILLSRFKR